MTSTNDCPRCGTGLAPGTKFCSECGSDVTSVGVGDAGAAATARISAIDVEATLLEFLKQATVGEFEIVKELGRGGMAMVYHARDLSLARDVAVKVMSPALGADASMAERFVREAQTAASLSHPNIIPVYAVRQTANITFFVMKMIKGRPLDDIMEEVGPLPIDLSAAILSQVAGALGYGHKRGIVHRDVKPGNVMIDDEGWAVVTDFGIAKVEAAEGLTQTGAAIGTPTYMSPEQCTAKDVTGASDQYSLGVVAYEMLTGRKPFDGDSVMSIMYAHVNEPPPSFLDERPDCPPELHNAVMRMLEKDSADRYADLEHLVSALSNVDTGARGDSARTEMISLAQSGVSSKVISNVRTPRSPVPMASIQKSAVHTGGVRPSAETVQTPMPVGAVDSGSLINSGQLPPPRKKPVGLIAAAVVAAVGISGLMVVQPWQAARGDAGGGETGGGIENPAGPVAPVVGSVRIDAPSTSVMESDELALSATALDNAGSPVEVAVSWQTSDRNVASVDAGGIVIARTAGRADISAEAGGQGTSVTITVTARPAGAPPPPTVASIAVTPRQASLSVGGTVSVTARVTGSDGRQMARTTEWRSENMSIATVSQGTITGVSAGRTTIFAVRDGFRASVSVTVTPAAVARVTVSANNTALEISEVASVTAALLAADGSTLSGRAVAWVSSNPAVVTVSGSGAIAAVAAGSANVSASVDGQSGSVTIRVAEAAPTGPTEAQSRTAILRLIDAYHTAFQARDIGAVSRAYAGMTGAQRTSWTTFFGGVENLRVSYTPNPASVSLSGETAEVQIDTRYDFRAGGRDLNSDFATVMRFTYRNSNWEMTEWQSGDN